MSAPGRIRDEDIDEVRRRAGIVDVAAEYMQVKRAGRQFKSLCPFHQEKTPSFMLDPVKGFYFCHGCSEGGDVISLVQRLENLSFAETIERLARRTGVELHYEQVSPSDRKAHKRRLRLIDAHREAVAFYHRALLEAPEAADARTYLKGRGIGREVAERFQVGFSPGGWDGLVKHLRSKGFSDDEMHGAGLAARTQDGRAIDRFRGRVMFPIFEVTGDPVAFGARRLRDEDDGPKYLNSAESPIYKKGQVLYALNWAKGTVVKAQRALIVEGYTDVIALHLAGLTEAIATCGTALGIDHLRTLQRFAQEVILSLDADEAGGKAAERTYDQMIGDAQALGLSLKVVLMPRGSDPADSVASLGAEGFRGLVDQAIPLLEFVLRREAQRYTVGDPEVRARALTAGLRILAKTEAEVVRMEYARRLSDWIKVDANVIFVELEKVMRTGTTSRATTEPVLRRSSAQVRLEKEAIKIALQHPVLVKVHLEECGPGYFSVPAHRTLWTAIADGTDLDTFVSTLDEDARRAHTELSVQPPEGEVNERLAAEVFMRLKTFVISRQIDELKPRLQSLNPTSDPEGYAAMFAQLMDLERRKRRLSDEGNL